MRNVIENVLAAEEEAKVILANAQKEADKLILASREAAMQMSEQTRRETRQEAEQRVATAEAEVKANTEKQIEQTKRDLQSDVQLKAADRERAIQVVVNTVLGVGA